MEAKQPDFSGWATKANLRCSDGRTITSKAFEHMDGKKVPLVWSHDHKSPSNVLGYAILHARPEGVWADGYFNDTEKGKESRKLVQHGDVESLSIYANELVEKSREVLHGMIREVSLVLSGANPGAKIMNVRLAHSDDPDDFDILEDRAVIFSGVSLAHAADDADEDEDEVEDDEFDDEEEDDVEHSGLTLQDVYNTFDDDQLVVVHSLLGAAITGEDLSEELAHADGQTIKDVYDTFNEDQKNVLHYMIGVALENRAADSAAHSDLSDDDSTTADGGNSTDEDTLAHQEGSTMSRNIFESAEGTTKGGTLTHDQFSSIMEDAKKPGQTLKSVLAHAEDYGINNIELLFPDAQMLPGGPAMIQRLQGWVSEVLDNVKKTPFAKVKSLVFDITAEEARAKGYVKGTKKVDEVIQLLRRSTGPTTIYKKQRLDRDDVIDITDMNVVAFLDAEMTVMIKEELARCILVGDGRSPLSDDKVKDPAGSIDGNGIRSILHDDDLYAIKHELAANVSYKDSIKGIVRARSKYRGTGSPTLFVSDNWLTEVMLLEDKFERPLYETIASLADKLRVSKIVPVEVFDDHANLLAILVNPADYSIGTNKGGELTSFEDFDIDFNQHKYLKETRLSGGLTLPFSAIVVTRALGTEVTPTNPSFDGVTNTITIPSVTGVVYTVDEEAVTGSVVITSVTEVVAVADEGYYLASGATTSWTYTP